VTEMHAPSKVKLAETRWQRWLRSLLYGNDVNRDVKAKARLGLAIVAFAGIYSVIALRLVMFASLSDGHDTRRSVGQDAVATARPDIVDRNGQILATDVKTPSLFAEPRKIIDVDEAVELLTAVMPDLDATEVRERLSSKRGFVWLKREISAKQQEEIHRLGIPGLGFLTENKRVYPNGPVISHEIGHVNIDNQGIAGIEKWARRLAYGGARHRPPAASGQSGGRFARAIRAARRTHCRAREIQGQGLVRYHRRRQHRRDHRAGLRARLRPQQSARSQRPDPHQPAHHRRL